MGSKVGIYFQALRIKHYVKGVVILAPMLFILGELRLKDIVASTALFIGFSLITSSIYTFNDIRDAADDRNDPFVKMRPYANGLISFFEMVSLTLGSLFLGLIVFATLSLEADSRNMIFAYTFLYILINLSYSGLRLKRFKLLGMIMVGVGFPIRFLLGSTLLGINNLKFITFLIFLLSLLVIAGKRYYRGLNMGKSTDWERIFHSLIYLNILAYLAFVTYSILGEGKSSLLILTTPLLWAILQRFKAIVHNSKVVKDLSIVFLFDKYIIFYGAIFSLILLFCYS